jgi:AcrR family transcriptional regulator
MVRWEPNSRRRLEAAAISLFSERGYDQTTVAEIAARAGVTERTFYRYFEVKREVLFSEATFLEALLVDVVASAPTHSTPMDIVLAALDVVVELLQQRPTHAVRRHAVIAATPELHERELIKMATLGGALADALRARGVSDLTASLTAESGITVFRVAYERWVLDPEAEDFGSVVRDSFDALRSATALP